MESAKTLQIVYGDEEDSDISQMIFSQLGFYITFYKLSVLCEYLDSELLVNDKDRLLRYISKDIISITSFSLLDEMEAEFKKHSDILRYKELIEQVVTYDDDRKQ